MIYVLMRHKVCMGYCTTLEKALVNVTKDIDSKYKYDDVIVETNRYETEIKVYKKYINMNTFPRTLRGLETCYTIYEADFLS